MSGHALPRSQPARRRCRPTDVLPARTIAIARTLTHWVVETPKPARAFLKTLAHAQRHRRARDRRRFQAHHAATRAGSHEGPRRRRAVRRRLPGRRRSRRDLVAAAHARRHSRGAAGGPVVAPARADGVRHERPAVRLPRLPAGARRRARAGAAPAGRGRRARMQRAQIFIETPYRNAAMIASLGAVAARRDERARGRATSRCRPRRSSGARRRRGARGCGALRRSVRRSTSELDA